MGSSGFLRDGHDRAGLCAAGLLAVSLVLGGGGSPAPLPEIAVQLTAALVAAIWLLSGGTASPWQRAPSTAWYLAGLIVLLPALQLIPLPPALWHSLPGRDDKRAALELVGAAQDWRALSLSPARTLASLLAAAAAALCLVLAATLDAAGRRRLIGVAALGGLATLLVGAAQLSGGPGNPLRFFDPEQIYLTGFQANHNSTADVILIAMLAMAAAGRHALDRGLVRLSPLQLVLTVAAVDAVMVLGLFLTGSRAGLALLPVVLVFQILILRRGDTAQRAPVRWGRAGLVVGGLLALAAGAAAILRDNRAIGLVLDRFTLAGEFRPQLWADSLFALGQYWPAGSGQGTFAPVLMAVERLEVVDPTLPNRAHNDYLELAIGGGLPGVILLGIIGLLIGRLAWRALRQPPAGGRAAVLFAQGTLAVIALHSLVDYPLRSMALAALAATAVGLLIPARPEHPAQARGDR
ncbi:MAG TPA: O-antigen ligase family protein [Novosphingobium sp.]|nr:O-antigen ligase family protein [Novosphingobium sp.]